MPEEYFPEPDNLLPSDYPASGHESIRLVSALFYFDLIAKSFSKVYQPETMLNDVLWTLRQRLGMADLVKNGLRVDCTCGWIFQADLWALETINILLEKGHNTFFHNCPQCGTECKFDLRTLEPV